MKEAEVALQTVTAQTARFHELPPDVMAANAAVASAEAQLVALRAELQAALEEA